MCYTYVDHNKYKSEYVIYLVGYNQKIVSVIYFRYEFFVLLMSFSVKSHVIVKDLEILN